MTGDHQISGRLRKGDALALGDLLNRDHGVAHLLASVAAADQSSADAALSRAWESVISDVVSGRLCAALRPALLERVVRGLDEKVSLDVMPAGPPMRGSFLPPGDRWEGWWSEEPRPWSSDAVVGIPEVVGALRRVALGLRVLLVLRDVAGLPAAEVDALMGISEQQQDVLLLSAREAYVIALDEALGGA